MEFFQKMWDFIFIGTAVCMNLLFIQDDVLCIILLLLTWTLALKFLILQVSSKVLLFCCPMLCWTSSSIHRFTRLDIVQLPLLHSYAHLPASFASLEWISSTMTTLKNITLDVHKKILFAVVGMVERGNPLYYLQFWEKRLYIQTKFKKQGTDS